MTLTKEELIAFEKAIEKLYLDGRIRAPIHLSGHGEEQIIEIFKNIKKDDWVFSSYRNHYHALLKGIPQKHLEEEILKGRSMHIMSKEHKFFTSSIVPGHLPIALGVALALKLQNAKNHVWAFCGDMGAETGTFHEVTKYAIRNELPITFVVEDNGLSVYTPTQEVWGKNKFSLITVENDTEEGKIRTNSHITRYSYERAWPHHGIGLWVNFDEDEKNKPYQYRNELKKAMALLAENNKTIFIGQTVRYKGSALYGTLEEIAEERRIELPIMENVQMGISTGLSLEGYIPVSVFPRFDFLKEADAQLVNHLDKISELSHGEFAPKVIIRTAVGSKKPLHPGPQHCQDYTDAYRLMLKNIEVIKLEKSKDIVPAYKEALKSPRSTLLVELADLYDLE